MGSICFLILLKYHLFWGVDTTIIKTFWHQVEEMRNKADHLDH